MEFSEIEPKNFKSLFEDGWTCGALHRHYSTGHCSDPKVKVYDW